ncbi:hypothetical protein K443DRAFT_681143 [Laccaria amethystina LaAM-08-1]|uniref:Uncharacterized protein n=1 Tax=Laccaria amethystina LaAM-08-1 TaxID=1095629 RepID=A0A0C9XPL4_9AGAR|nr:hypothetical protein K443DRAFT_681143 [Laccaria amethystina LaAM-08-1]
MCSIATVSAGVFYDSPTSLVHREQPIPRYCRVNNRSVESCRWYGGSRDVWDGARRWSPAASYGAHRPTPYRLGIKLTPQHDGLRNDITPLSRQR